MAGFKVCKTAGTGLELQQKAKIVKQHLGLKKQSVHGLKSTQPIPTKIKSPKILNCTGEEFWIKSFKQSIGQVKNHVNVTHLKRFQGQKKRPPKTIGTVVCKSNHQIRFYKSTRT